MFNILNPFSTFEDGQLNGADLMIFGSAEIRDSIIEYIYYLYNNKITKEKAELLVRDKIKYNRQDILYTDYNIIINTFDKVFK